MLIIFIPAGIIILFLVFHLVFTSLWDRGLTADIAFSSERVHAGSKTGLLLTLTNAKRMPIPVMILEFKVRRGLDFSENENITVTDRVNVLEYFSVGGREEITRTCDITAAKRGIYRIDELFLTVPEIFEVGTQRLRVRAGTRLTVVPKKRDAGEIEGISELLLGETAAKKRLYEDVFSFRGIREYTTSDPLSAVNWKASARTGDLMVNERDFTFGREVKIFLNVDVPGIRYDGNLLEEGISIAFAAAAAALAAKMPVSLFTNGCGISGKMIRIEAGSSRGHLVQIGDALAAIELEQRVVPFEEVLGSMKLSPADASVTHVLISSAMGDKLIRAASDFSFRAGGLIWLCPLSPGMEAKKVPSNILFRTMVIKGGEETAHEK